MGWDDEGEATVGCPYCNEQIHEDSQRCPHCENYISEEDAPPGRKPRWIVVGLVICLIIAVMWIVNR
jgi:predicted nucleic acid-binding Zn ribbon protein